MFCNEALEDITPIVPYLYLGNIKAATMADQLKEREIKHIISVVGAKDEITGPNRIPGISYRHYSKMDQPNEDLLTILPECIDHMRMLISHKETILVHCMVGASRSATVVIAYLMVTNRWSNESALSFVKGRRPVVNPNVGFRYQLRLFERMQCRIDITNKEFRVYLLNLYGFIQYPDNLLNHLTTFLFRVNEYEQAEKKPIIGSNFKCGKCGGQLFTDLNLIQASMTQFDGINPQGQQQGQQQQTQYPTAANSTGKSTITENQCKYYLIEPVQWMINKSRIFINYQSVSSGPINCYCCGIQLGRYNFYPFQASICTCDEHRLMFSFLSLAIFKDSVKRKVVRSGFKGFLGGIFSTH